MFFKRDSPIETGMKRKKDNKKVKLSLYTWTLMHLRKDNIIT